VLWVRVKLELFRALVGRPPTHCDGHQHCHILPTIAAALAPVLAAAGVRAVRIPEERGYLPANSANDDVSGLLLQTFQPHETAGTFEAAVPSSPPPPTLPLLPPPTLAPPAVGEPHWTVATRPALCDSCSAAQALAPPARQLYAAYGLTSPCAFVGCSLCGLGSTYSVSDFLAAVDAQINWLRAAAAEAALPLGAAPADDSATPAAAAHLVFEAAAAAIVGSIDASNAPPWKKRTFSTAECISGSACAILATAASTAARRAPLAFVVEAMCHPGWAEEGLAVHEDSGLRSWDAFSASTARAHEVAVLGDAALRAGLASRGVRLVSYRESGLLD